MTTFRHLVAVLLALAFIAATPAAAFAAVMAAPDCQVMPGDVGVEDCCGVASGLASCNMACGVSFFAVVGSMEKPLAAFFGGASFGDYAVRSGLTAGPPDTPPPKRFPTSPSVI